MSSPNCDSRNRQTMWFFRIQTSCAVTGGSSPICLLGKSQRTMRSASPVKHIFDEILWSWFQPPHGDWLPSWEGAVNLRDSQFRHTYVHEADIGALSLPSIEFEECLLNIPPFFSKSHPLSLRDFDQYGQPIH